MTEELWSVPLGRFGLHPTADGCQRVFCCALPGGAFMEIRLFWVLSDQLVDPDHSVRLQGETTVTDGWLRMRFQWEAPG